MGGGGAFGMGRIASMELNHLKCWTKSGGGGRGGRESTQGGGGRGRIIGVGCIASMELISLLHTPHHHPTTLPSLQLPPSAGSGVAMKAKCTPAS